MHTHQLLVTVSPCAVYFGDCERWTPLLLKNIQADASLAVDIRMVHSRFKHHFGRLKWIVRRKCDAHKEHASRVWRVGGTHDCRLCHTRRQCDLCFESAVCDAYLPVEQVVAHGPRAARSGRVPLEVLKQSNAMTQVFIDARVVALATPSEFFWRP